MVLELELHLRQLIDGIERAGDGTLQLSRPPAEPRFLEPLSGLYWQIAAEPPAAGGAILRSRSLWDTTLQLPPDPLVTGEVHRHVVPGPGSSSLLAVERSVTLAASLGSGGVRAAVALDRNEIHAAGRAFAADLAPSLALLAGFLLAAAWVQVTVGLRPLECSDAGSPASARAGRRGSGRPDSRTRCGRSPPSWTTCSTRRTRRWRGRGRAPPTSRTA